MKIENFEDWLQEFYITRVNPQIIKDEFEDAFDNYLSGLEGEDYLELAQRYGDYVQMKMQPKDI